MAMYVWLYMYGYVCIYLYMLYVNGFICMHVNTHVRYMLNYISSVMFKYTVYQYIYGVWVLSRNYQKQMQRIRKRKTSCRNLGLLQRYFSVLNFLLTCIFFLHSRGHSVFWSRLFLCRLIICNIMQSRSLGRIELAIKIMCGAFIGNLIVVF